ncbi:MAG: hypothetical protein JWN89_393 [Parcubacteria group bacterium]|nr:hypothetical protein [Parcubacteria group bacterium]
MNNEETPKVMLNPEIASELETMVKVDQDMREKNLVDDEYWDNEIDKRNTERLKEIVVEIGWPTTSKVGAIGVRNAWLLIQHADHDKDFQKKCLELMKAESPEEVDRKHVAYLEDRIRVSEHGLQVYGTQFRDRDGNFRPEPIEDEKHVDERRAEIGLEPIEQYTREIREKYGFPQE